MHVLCAWVYPCAMAAWRRIPIASSHPVFIAAKMLYSADVYMDILLYTTSVQPILKHIPHLQGIQP